MTFDPKIKLIRCFQKTVFLFYFFIMIFFGASCDVFQIVELEEKKTFSEDFEESPQEQLKAQKSWLEILESQVSLPYKISRDDSLAYLSLENSQGLELSDYEKILLKITQEFHENLDFKVVIVQANGINDSLIRSRIYLTDVFAYQEKVISRPELLRRFETKTLETLPSIKNKLKKARFEKDHEKALNLLDEWLVMEPDDPLAHHLTGNVFRDQDKHWTAVQSYRKALEQDPENLLLIHNLAYCFDKIGSYKESVDFYKQALEADPDNPLFMKQIAHVYRKLSDINATLFWLGKADAITKDSDHELIKGNLYRDQKNYKKALISYQRVLRENPDDERALYNIVLVHLDQKNQEKAKQAYADLLDKDPLVAEELAEFKFLY